MGPEILSIEQVQRTSAPVEICHVTRVTDIAVQGEAVARTDEPFRMAS